MKIHWAAEKGLMEAVPQVVHEFRVVRKLTPVKLVVIGPPFSGKTAIAKVLSETFDIFYLNVRKIRLLFISNGT